MRIQNPHHNNNLKGKKMKNIKTYVNNLDDSEKKSIIRGYERLEIDGTIGNEALRFFAEEYSREYGVGDHMIIFVMRELAFEAYRFYASAYLEA